MIRIINIPSLLILSLILFITYNSFPQSKEINFEHLSVEDGLPTNSTWDITQDYLGFMWFITSNGIVKYDGYEFTIYQSDQNDPNSIYVSDGASLYEDKSHNLWIALVNGMSLYNREADNFTNYLNDPEAEETNTNVFYDIIEDNTGTLWVGTLNRLLKLVKHPEKLISDQNIIEKSYIHDPEDSTSIVSNCVYRLYEDRSGILWLATDKGLCKYNKETDDFTTYRVNRKDHYNYNRMYSILEDSKNNFWIGTIGGGLAKFDRKKCEFDFISFTNYRDYNPELPISKYTANNLQRSILEDYDGTLWITTTGAGLINFNPSTKKFSLVVHDPSNPHSLSSGGDLTYTLYRDHSNAYWVSSRQGGINKFSKEIQFKHVKNYQTDKNGLGNRPITYIYEDKEGIIWIGTSGGILNKFNSRTSEFTQFRIGLEDINLINSNYIRCIYEDKDGLLWIGTQLTGLYKFDKKTGKFTSIIPVYKDARGRINYITVTSIIEDISGRLWIGSEGLALCEINKINGEIYYHNKYNYESGMVDSISTKSIYDMYMDKEGILWFVSQFGSLNRYNPATGYGKKYKFDMLSGDYVFFSIYEDRQNRIWIGRNSGGLLRFDKKSESYKIYRTGDGLPDETVGAILEDDNGYLWMRTGTSICRFNPENETFKIVYRLYQGFQKFNCWRAWKSKLTCEMYFPGDDGFYVFHPDSIKDNLVPPKIVLTDFLISDERVHIGNDSPLKKHISLADEVVLEHWQNDFSIEFASLHYTNPASNQHKYKLTGYDDDWKTADANRLAKYTNMSPGEYVFRAIGSNSDGIWNEEGASLKIIILPPWWATTWAYFTYALLIIGLIYFVWRMQLRRVKIKHEYEMSKFEAEKMHEVDEMKNRFFANLSHEFRTPLTLIFGPTKDIIEKTKELKTKENAGIIKRNASKLYSLVNQLLDLSKLEAGKMKLETIEQNIIPLLKGYVLSFSSLAERKKIELKFNTVEEDLKAYIDKDKLEKIVNNLLSNAFKFTPEGGKIVVSVSKPTPMSPPGRGIKGVGHKGEVVEISVSDNGIGIAKERLDKIFNRFYQVDGSHTRESEGTGIGLSLTKELVELHKGKIEVESEYGRGTTFTVLLPLGKGHLEPEEIVEKELSEEVKVAAEEAELIPETERKKEKLEIDVLLATDKKLLLIVEDNPDVRSYIISHLEEEYRILEAANGEEGLREALEHFPELIISDVMMPKMDGFGLCNKLKTDERTSHIPVILLTAKATDKDKIVGYETGADDYIMKPFDSGVLKVRIKNLIDQRRKLREQFRKEGLIEIEDKEITSIDKKFLQNVLQTINKYLSDTSFGVEMLANEISMSRRNLDRKLVSLTGDPPSDLIRRVRLTQAAKLIAQKFGNISEIAMEVGFSNPAYFSKCFSEQFGLSPSEYKTDHSK
jgi:signal transduction histidine kinase/ligand-binding sensor domain-containing protein/CheY-like chemotaxis protein